jgi:hypothetical protein
MREFLKGLELDKETIDTIMAEHGKLLTGSKEQIEELKAANKTLGGELAAATTTAEQHAASITELTAKLAQFDGLDAESLKGQAATISAEWQGKLTQAEKDAADKIAAIKFDAAVMEGLADVKFTSSFAKSAIAGLIREKGLQLDNGKILGFEDAIATLRESNADAFAVTPEPEPGSVTPPPMYAGAGRSNFQNPPPADDAITSALKRGAGLLTKRKE